VEAGDDSKRPERLRIKVRGVVQGVGFRPYVHGLAAECGLMGYVCNTSEGVTIEVEGAEARGFASRLSEEAPPLAGITEVEVVPLPPLGYEDFKIVESGEAGSFTLLSPDVSTCDDCLAEMRDPGDRRHRYPFINCTNCGPRYSITRAVPYDRPNTTMSAFAMCPLCEREYRDPADRRFHAVPNACPSCGPGVTLFKDGSEVACADPVSEAAALLRGGSIVAVKGLGGFHLACDAENAVAVGRLRRRKRKSNKPFALMAPDVRAGSAMSRSTRRPFSCQGEGRWCC
jgi:hydrogenase maturation protein HypF